MLKASKHRAFCLGAAAPLCIAASLWAPGSAAASVETVQHTVVYRDLDLTGPKGVATFRRRVTAAVHAVCGTGSRLLLEERAAFEGCVADAEASARVKMAQVVRDARLRAGLPPAETLAQASLASR